jgi:hypothetical protein
MQRAERRRAKLEGRRPRALTELDYLLGVSDETRLGALRFRWVGDDAFQAPVVEGVPALITLGRLMESSQRIMSDQETDEDLRLIYAPGSSLGGARPKASVIDQHNHLSIAKFPKDDDDYSIETWEEIAMRSLSPAYDLNPTPTDLKERILTTNVDLDEGTCSLELLENASGYFDLNLAAARTIIKEVALATSKWRTVAKKVRARSAEIDRMSSAFEHDDLQKALAL